MSYTPRSRDRYRLAVATVTGLAGAGAITASGWLAGMASTGSEVDEGVDPAAPAAGDARRDQEVRENRPVVLRERPHRVRVTTRYVGAGVDNVRVGGGGTVRSVSQPAVRAQAIPPAQAPAAASTPTPAPTPAPAPPPPAPSTAS